MIKLISNELQHIGLLINASKCHLFRIGKNYKHEIENLHVDGSKMYVSKSEKYFGVFIKSGKKFMIDIEFNIHKFCTSLNAMFAGLKGKIDELIIVF